MSSARASTAARYPKRKRTQVDYAEPEEESEDYSAEDGSQDAVEFSQTKKRKLATSKPLPRRRIFPFLRLPAEIRNYIYELCLTEPVGVYLRSTTKKFRRTVHQVSEKDLKGNHDNCWERFDDGSDSDGVSNADTSSNADGSSNADSDERGKAKEDKKTRRGPSEEKAPLVPALLAVCKQMNLEGRNLLYGNHFYLEDPLALHSFLVDIGPRPASLLKNVTLMGWSDGRGHRSYNHTCFTALMAATNLESFNTHGYMRCGTTAKLIATQIYRDAFPWLEAVGREKGRTDAAVDVFNIKCIAHGDFDQQDDFREELRKLLNARIDRIRS